MYTWMAKKSYFPIVMAPLIDSSWVVTDNI